ncbi:terminase [Tsukamurella paurometabola]|uniref:Phage terminase-like protein, large subunit n=1 Tax=Tsukamurella paurometabola TaxID=2061 RepID=A0A3P8LCD3_TSUPA|nr:terminase [Tsukamurella paurometabola]UEA84418.1 hypothetical protein LK411_06235 [Tsukamurella paurometabola]VDR36982.1 Phage terminase-like protein, large subunit [Tsukamurella paurometabola]
MATTLSAGVATKDDDSYAALRAPADWYWHELEGSSGRVAPKRRWEPVKIGPTWQTVGGGWVLPKLTLGWHMLGWCGMRLRGPDGAEQVFTLEQARFLLWYYAVDENGRWLTSNAVLQRLKGWGKDPLGAAIAAYSAFGPSMVDRIDDDGTVHGTQNPAAWVQVVAVSQEQTKNTMKLFPTILPPETIRRYGIQIGRLNVWGLGDTVQIEAITSSPLAVEGGRPTQVIRNETQNWNSSNQGHDLAGAVDGNVAKSPRGTARILDICNAYRPGTDSVGERTREAWENACAAGIDIGLLYDSLEAPPDAPLTVEEAPAVLEAVRGDAYWLDTASDGEILKSIARTTNSPSESRRKWYNQITATADAWITPQAFDVQAVPQIVADGEPVVLFFDGSKSDDSTGLVGCRLSDGFVFTAGVWERPPGREVWQVDREAVDLRVTETVERLNVIGLWADPSDARDDETGERFWEDLLDRWARRWGRQFTMHAVKTGDGAHPIIWDMRSPAHQKLFVEHAERAMTDIMEGNFPHDGHKKLAQHVKNARRRPSKYGVSLGKEHRESRRKVDLAVCAVGARMMWRIHQAAQADAKIRTNQAMSITRRRW